MNSKSDNAKSPSLLRSGALISALTMVSRVLGFMRDQILAIRFGTGGLMDVFFLVFAIPNFLRRLFGEGAFSQAFVPVFASLHSEQDHALLRRFCANVSGTLGGVLLGLSIAGMLGAGELLSVVAPGLAADPMRFAAASDMLAMTFPYLFFICMVAYASGVLNSLSQFAVPALTPVLLNATLIIFALLPIPGLPAAEYRLALAVSVAGALQLVWQLPWLIRAKLLPRPRWNHRDPNVRRVMWLMAPALLGASAAQINLLFNRFVASFMPEGSFSWLYMSDRLVELPIGIFAVALGTVVLPRLSRDYGNADIHARQSVIDWGQRLGLLLTLPCCLGLIIAAEALYATLFTYGRFEILDAQRSAIAMRAYALSLPAYALIKIQSAVFFSRQDTRTPVRIGLESIGVNILCTIALVYCLRQFYPEIQHAGLALATSTAAWWQCLRLQYTLKRCGEPIRLLPGGRRYIMQLSLAVFGVCLVIWPFVTQVPWFEASVWVRIGSLGAMLITALFTYLALLYLSGVRVAEFKR